MPDEIVPQTDDSEFQFDFKGISVRAKVGLNGKPIVRLNDICEAIGINNPRQAASRLDDDEKGVISTDTLGGKQDVLYVNESGLYSLVLSSRKSDAKAFKRWITHEVLPAIYRYGGYISPDATNEQLLVLQAQVDTLQRKLSNSYQVNRWLGERQGAGRFIEQSLPEGDRD